MMRRQGMSIKWRLTLSFILFCFFSLLIALVGFSTFDLAIEKKAMLSHYIQTSNTIGHLVLSTDPRDIKQLEMDPDIIYGAVFENSGKLVAEYKSLPGDALPTVKNLFERYPEDNNVYKSKGHFIGDTKQLLLIQAIKRGDEQLGYSYLTVDATHVYGAMMYHVKLFILLCGIMLVVACLVALTLQRMITRPLGVLLDTMRKITHEGSYEVRVNSKRDDEVGDLIKQFNEMLYQVNSRDLALAQHQEDLENIVRKRTEELHEAKEAAETANNTKSLFLANMSHEIRTPLNVMSGMIELFNGTPLTKTQKGYLKSINRSSEMLLKIINDILDFSKNEAGKLVLDEVEFDMRQLVESTVMLFSEKASEHHLDLNCYLPPRMPERVISDPARFTQVLTNLLSNAIKFTSVGGVSLAVTDYDVLENEVCMRFEIQDTGKGISKANLDHIFEVFTQEDVSTNRQYGGTGLGLAICKQLVELMQGEIGVESLEGQGSVFWFTCTLKLQATPQADVYYGLTPSDKGKQVCLFTHNPFLENMINDYCDSWTASLEKNTDLSVVLASVQEDNFDKIIIDTGSYTTETIAGTLDELKAHAHKLIWILKPGETLDAVMGDAKPFGVVLNTPLFHQTLYDSLHDVTTLAYADMAQHNAIQGEQLGDGLSGRILVAEDNSMNQEVIRIMLEKLSCKIDLANNGSEAVALFKQHHYAVVLMDCQMPGMDGFEATRQIRAYEAQRAGSETPILALTANVTPVDRRKCFEAGMTDFISKPFKYKMLVETIARHCNTVHVGAGTKNQPPSVTTQKHSIFNPEKLGEVFDLNEASDIEQIKDVLANYSKQVNTLTHNIHKAINANKMSDIAFYAHSLKSCSGQIGAEKLFALALSLEAYAKTHEADDTRVCKDDASKIIHAYHDFSATVDSWFISLNRETKEGAL